MKYSINVNQEELALTSLDVIDAAIIDYLFSFDHFSYWQLLVELPLLRFKSKGSITRRLRKIEKEGFIVITNTKLAFRVALSKKGKALLKKWPVNSERINPNQQPLGGVVIGQCLQCKVDLMPLVSHHLEPKSKGGLKTERICLNCHFLNHYARPIRK